jgi:hypothetical protein
VSGLLWEHFGAQEALLFSLAGTAGVTLFYLLFGSAGSDYS